MAGAFVADIVFGLSSLYFSGALRMSLIEPDKLVYALVGACGFQATMLLGAVWQGRLAGNGDLRAGLGIARVRRVVVIALLCAATIVWMACFAGLTEAFPALHALVKAATPELLSQAGVSGPLGFVLRAGLLAVLAPVSEELFFRGWLWESLRRRGFGTAATAVMTALPWLLLHGLDSPWRIVFLVPAAMIFSTARVLGGSVVASLSAHMTNNTAVVLMQTAAEMLTKD